jgi:hypothetical protein
VRPSLNCRLRRIFSSRVGRLKAGGELTRVMETLNMKYDLPIDTYEQAVRCLAEAQRRYRGKAVLDEYSRFPLIEDAAGVCHTNDVLRAIGAQFGPKLVGECRTDSDEPNPRVAPPDARARTSAINNWET